jgi:hypothetical protein
MDWLVGLGINWWVVALAVSVALNIWQAVYHTGIASGLKAKLDHVFTHGHPIPGTVLVPASSVITNNVSTLPVTGAANNLWAWQSQPQVSNVPPWERK